MTDYTYIDKNLAAVRAELAAAAQGREVQLVAAVKYATDGELLYLLESGVDIVGENRVQQLLAHHELYRAHGTRVHFIGTLQTNKVRQLIDKVDMIHSVSSIHLAAEIEKRAAALPRTVDVLVEINAAEEASKTGADPREAEALAHAVDGMEHLRLCGFMTMGPRYETEGEYRAYFRAVADMAGRIWRSLGKSGEPLLSMGMSESAAAALKEGTDMVRVGRRLFAGRPEQEE